MIFTFFDGSFCPIYTNIWSLLFKMQVFWQVFNITEIIDESIGNQFVVLKNSFIFYENFELALFSILRYSKIEKKYKRYSEKSQIVHLCRFVSTFFTDLKIGTSFANFGNSVIRPSSKENLDSPILILIIFLHLLFWDLNRLFM